MLEANRLLNLHHSDFRAMTGQRVEQLKLWAEHTVNLPDHAPIVWPEGFTRDEAEDALYDEYWSRLRVNWPYQTEKSIGDLALKLSQGRTTSDHASSLAGLIVTLLFGLGLLVCFLIFR